MMESAISKVFVVRTMMMMMMMMATQTPDNHDGSYDMTFNYDDDDDEYPASQLRNQTWRPNNVIYTYIYIYMLSLKLSSYFSS
jgi:hypothetical protein